MPERIKLSRARGWRKPEGAIVVARPSKWGNPFRFGDKQYGLVRYGPKHQERFGREWDFEGRCSAPGISHHLWFAADDIVETYVRLATRAEAVELFRLTIFDPTEGMRMAYPSAGGHFAKFTVEDVRRELAGHDLCCWCPLPVPGEPDICHAAVLLSIAAGETP